MKPPEYYRGREQTYLKHFLLERYLGRVAYNIFSFKNDFVYVDGFSGPWKSEDEHYEDTSFVIALNELRKIRDGFRVRGRHVGIRCLFIEKDPFAFRQLVQAVNSVEDFNVKVLEGPFESLIPLILQFIGDSFSLVFIDPTGWTGFGLKEISPILRHRPGEVLLNFMFDPVNRFLEHPRPDIAATYDPLFGGGNWHVEVEALVNSGLTREEAVLTVYRERFRSAGDFTHVTSTRILKPLADRSYFHLVYGTRHWKGLVEFRAVEKKAVDLQERVHNAAKYAHRVRRTHQLELFGPGHLPGVPRSFEAERANQIEAALGTLRELITDSPGIKYEKILDHLLEHPLVWESDIKHWLNEMCSSGEIQIKGLPGRTRTPKPGCVIAWADVAERKPQ